jgi:hypothetical protein
MTLEETKEQIAKLEVQLNKVDLLSVMTNHRENDNSWFFGMLTNFFLFRLF